MYTEQHTTHHLKVRVSVTTQMGKNGDHVPERLYVPTHRFNLVSQEILEEQGAFGIDNPASASSPYPEIGRDTPPNAAPDTALETEARIHTICRVSAFRNIWFRPTASGTVTPETAPQQISSSCQHRVEPVITASHS